MTTAYGSHSAICDHSGLGLLSVLPLTLPVSPLPPNPLLPSSWLILSLLSLIILRLVKGGILCVSEIGS